MLGCRAMLKPLTFYEIICFPIVKPMILNWSLKCQMKIRISCRIVLTIIWKLNFSKSFIVDYARTRASDFKHLPAVALSILSKSTNFLLIYLISINMSSRFYRIF